MGRSAHGSNGVGTGLGMMSVVDASIESRSGRLRKYRRFLERSRYYITTNGGLTTNEFLHSDSENIGEETKSIHF